MLINSAVTASVATAASATIASNTSRECRFAKLISGVLMIPLRQVFQFGCCRFGMTHGTVAARALQSCSLTVHNISINLRSDIFVATAAGVFRHLVIEFRDLDDVRVPAAGEIK
jgi:hypothetical protein